MGQTVEIKICGLTTLEDAQAAQEAGADFLGFVLYHRSPRGITAETLRRIMDRMKTPPRAVGVFVNASRDQVIQLASDCGLFAVQLHGDEPASDFLNMPVRLWRAVRLRSGAPSPLPECWPAERYVLDAEAPGAYGGTGTKVDWTQAAALAQQCPVMLAGGLTPDNVTEAIQRVSPLGVDVASGVESAPGKKDPWKLQAFIQAVRSCRRAPTSVISGDGRNSES